MKPLSRALLMLALVLGAINLRPGITSLAPLIERIAAELSLSRGLMSLTTALPVLCMGLLAPLAPRLAVRFGLERVIAGCLGLIGLALAARLGSHHSAVLIGSAAALGAGIAIAGPLMSGFIKRHFPDNVGRAVGWYALSMTLGGAAGAVLTEPVMRLTQGGWHLGLAAWAIPAGVAMLLWLCLPNRAESAEEGGAAGLPWREPRAWLITAFFAIQAGLFYALATWLVARYGEAGFSSLRSNSLFSLFMLMGLPSAFVLPWLAQRFGNRYHLLLACGFISTLCLAMITFAPTQVPELWALLLGLGLSGSFSLAMVLPLYEVNSSLAVSRWTAMMLFAGYSLGSLTPVLAGLGRDLAGDYQGPFMVITALASLLCVLAWLLGRGRADARK